MSTTNGKLHREAIRRTLVHRAGGFPEASAAAEATSIIWHQIAASLAPVIGMQGVDVLLSRSLHLTRIAFPWFAIAGDHHDSAALLAGLKVRLADREPEVAAEASYTLLVTFTELLTTLIGQSLTERLLDPVWAPLSTASEQEMKQ